MFCPSHGKTDPCPGGVGLESDSGRKLRCDPARLHCPLCGDALVPGLQDELF